MKRLIVAITGSSGVILGIRLLQTLRETDIETHLIVSPAAAINSDSKLPLVLVSSHSITGALEESLSL